MSTTASIPTSSPPLPVEVFGAKIDHIDLPGATTRIVDWIHDPAERTRFVVVAGFHGLWVAHEDPDFLALLNGADLFCADGIAPIWLSKLQGRPLPGRIPGPDLLKAVMEKANTLGLSSFFYGNSDDTLKRLRQRLDEQYPGHRIAGMIAPPFRPLTAAEDDLVVQQINAAKPDVLWVGLGLPKQERWINEHRDQLDVPVAIGVGAAFGFLAGTVSRAPRWVGNLGFEWAWRLAAEPRKLWRRDLIDGPQFVYHALCDVAHHRHENGAR